MSDTKKRLDFGLLGRVLSLANPYRLAFASAAILAIILAPLAVLRPYLIQVTVDDAILRFEESLLLTMIYWLCGILLLEVLLRYAFTYITNWLGQSVIRDLRTRVFDHILSLRLTYFDRTPIGTSTTRTINDIETINTVFSQGVITIIADLLSLIAVLGIMFYTSWQLTLVILVTFPFLIAATYVFKEKVKSAFQVVRTQVSRMNAFLQERVTGMGVVQIFNAEEQEMERFKVINRRYTQANLDSILYYAIFFPVIEIISAAALGLMIWWGAREVVDGTVTLGVLVAFPLYLSMLFRPMRMLADKFNTLQMGLVAAERVFKLIDNDSKIEDRGELQPESLQGRVEFDSVDFSYDGLDNVLNDLSFTIAAGDTMAIIGSTGSGKSTIINILNRFYPLREGSIKIDGTDIREYDRDTLRSRIAVVLQDVFLFSGSVFENITLRDPSVTREQVEIAARMIGAHDFIMRLPGGYDYKVMERGATLSMGQRQLISFVRALVFDPDILILDEATSSIDPESEAVIQYAIEQLIARRTSIIIAHRLSTIRHADQVMVLGKGKVLELGTPEELLQNPEGHYRQLYDLQFANVS